ncbi:hypothetical protein IW261DRAFT_1345683 [Armillaria novae-zelandiae]|uniref:Uncharacterized protein n=1 Tax=Armillaria novae-zelandiae TaxID=153914 RepID=A0AA39NNN8_9AGAR|nr:hypothetical protein IW261DRAFT_1345683 [Armillaria novae-zelandiae]
MEDDAKRYEETWKSSAGTTPACGLDQFSVFFQGPPASAWNKSAARVLTQHIMRNIYNYTDDDYSNRSIIEAACLSHIRSMCANYRARLKPPMVQMQKQRDGNKASRKTSASIFLIISKMEYEPRLACLNGGIHGEALDLLGPEAMSSDEEAQQDLHTVYKIRMPYWRSDSVTAWLRSFDHFHNQRRISNAAGASLRIIPHAEEEQVNKTAQYKRRLPRNAYNPTWLAAQPAGEVLLNIQPSPERADLFVQDPTWHT